MKTKLKKELFAKIPKAKKLCENLLEANLDDYKYRVDSLKKRGNKKDFMNLCMWIQAVEADKEVITV